MSLRGWVVGSYIIRLFGIISLLFGFVLVILAVNKGTGVGGVVPVAFKTGVERIWSRLSC
jgi:hypothetical protein